MSGPQSSKYCRCGARLKKYRGKCARCHDAAEAAKLQVNALRIHALTKHCYLCGRNPDDGGGVTADHIIPRSRDGSNEPANLAGCCRQCNSAKGNMLVGEYRSFLEALTGRPVTFYFETQNISYNLGGIETMNTGKPDNRIAYAVALLHEALGDPPVSELETAWEYTFGKWTILFNGTSGNVFSQLGGGVVLFPATGKVFFNISTAANFCATEAYVQPFIQGGEAKIVAAICQEIIDTRRADLLEGFPGLKLSYEHDTTGGRPLAQVAA